MKLGQAALSTCFVAGLLVGLFSPLARAAEVESFAAQVEEIDRLFQPHESRVGEITRVLTLEPAFNNLAADGDRLVDPCLAYLAEPGHSQLQRRIAILATYEASVTEWVRFSNKILDMYENNTADIWEAQDTIFPRRIYLNYAEDYFWEPSVRRLLNRLYYMKGVDHMTRGRPSDRRGPLVYRRWIGQ